MKNLFSRLNVLGSLFLICCSSGICMKERKSSDESAERPSCILKNLKENSGKRSSRAKTGGEKKALFLLPDSVLPSKPLAAQLASSSQPGLVIEEIEGLLGTHQSVVHKKRFYRKHPGVTALLMFSGVAVCGITPIAAVAIICAAICAPQWIVCFSGFLTNQTFGYCPTPPSTYPNSAIQPLFTPPLPQTVAKNTD